MKLAVVAAGCPLMCMQQAQGGGQSGDGPQMHSPGGKGGASAAILEEGNALPDLLNSEARTRFV